MSGNETIERAPTTQESELVREGKHGARSAIAVSLCANPACRHVIRAHPRGGECRIPMCPCLKFEEETNGFRKLVVDRSKAIDLPRNTSGSWSPQG